MAQKGINKVILIGNLGRDPETRYLPSGGAVTNVTLATSESWKDKQSGQMQERTEWHRVVFFNKLAEIAGEYLKKGSKVYIEGSLRTRTYDKDGQKHPGQTDFQQDQPVAWVTFPHRGQQEVGGGQRTADGQADGAAYQQAEQQNKNQGAVLHDRSSPPAKG